MQSIVSEHCPVVTVQPDDRKGKDSDSTGKVLASKSALWLQTTI